MMPEWLLALTSIFKKDIFSVKYMLIILFWIVGLAITPDYIELVFKAKVKIPFAYEVAVFAASALLSSLFLTISNGIKAVRSERQLKKEQISKEDKRIEKMNEITHRFEKLNNDEQDVIRYLLNSGYTSISVTAEKIPKHILTLVYKEFIYQCSSPDRYFNECKFSLIPSTEKALRDALKEAHLNHDTD